VKSNDKVYLDIIQRHTELKMTVWNLHASFLIIYIRVFNSAYVVYAKCLTQFMIILNKWQRSRLYTSQQHKSPLHDIVT